MAQKITGLQVENTAYAYGDISAGSNATITAKPLANVVYSGITYSSNTFTVTTKGLYFIQAQQLMEATTGIYLQININNVSVRYGYHSGGPSYVRDILVADMRILNVGDTIKIGQQGSTSTTWGGAHSSFQIFLVKRTT